MTKEKRMASSKAVAERPASQVPALRPTPSVANEIGADDIALPRIYVGQFMSAAVQEQLVKMGDIYTATGADDPDPQVHWTIGSEEPGLLFYVLVLTKKKSFSEQGGELQLWDYDDPSADPRAWVTYNYVVYCPTIDDAVPCKLLLTRTGRPAALQINTVLKKNSITGPMYLNAFRLTSSARENAKGKYAIARVAGVKADAKQVKAAERLAIQMSAAVTEHGATGEEPAI